MNPRRDWRSLRLIPWHLARSIGKHRQLLRERTFGSSHCHEDSSWENVMGVAGEYAYGNAVQLPVPVFRPELEFDEGFDFTTCVGRVDVKGMNKPPWFMAVTDRALEKYPGADYYAQVWCPVDEPIGYLTGFATREEMAQAPHVDHCHDPDGRYGFEGSRPGRWLRVEEQLHPGGLLLDAILARTPAACWVCPSCLVIRFAGARPECDRCLERMVEANAFVRIRLAEEERSGDQPESRLDRGSAHRRGVGAERVPREPPRHRAGRYTH